jgi:tetratricopeptide (TPR) repeat protein
LEPLSVGTDRSSKPASASAAAGFLLRASLRYDTPRMATISIQRAFELGVAKHQQRKLAEAETLYRQVLTRDPNFAAGYYMLAVLGQDMGRTADAIPLAKRAIELNGGVPDFHIFLGVLLATSGQLESAIASFRRALMLKPNNPDARNNLGNALRETGRPQEAIAEYQLALRGKPDFAEVLNNLSNAYRDVGRFGEAVESARKAITLKPGYAGALNNLGNGLKELGQFTEAGAAYAEALAFQPNYSDAYYNIGNLEKEKGDLDAAVKAYERALQMRPQFPSARWNLGLTLLLKGDYERGWDAYEARWDVAKLPADRGLAKPLWDGGELNGKRIVLHAEQGLGDTIQFIRYAPLLQKMGGHVYALVSPDLERLFKGQPGIEKLLVDEFTLPKIDVHCPMLTAPRLMKTTVETIPADVPYLNADASLVAKWKEQLDRQGDGKRKIGLVWAGRPENQRDRRRTMALEQFAPLSQTTDIQLFSLQKGDAARQAGAPPVGMNLINLAPQLTDFAETAAAIMNLDLVISVDTAVAHLAGALGRPVWTMIPFSPDWRWLLKRTDSPWYPTMRLVRQHEWGKWDDAVADVVNALR